MTLARSTELLDKDSWAISDIPFTNGYYYPKNNVEAPPSLQLLGLLSIGKTTCVISNHRPIH